MLDDVAQNNMAPKEAADGLAVCKIVRTSRLGSLRVGVGVGGSVVAAEIGKGFTLR
jgi:hypothetical protein